MGTTPRQKANEEAYGRQHDDSDCGYCRPVEEGLARIDEEATVEENDTQFEKAVGQSVLKNA